MLLNLHSLLYSLTTFVSEQAKNIEAVKQVYYLVKNKLTDLYINLLSQLKLQEASLKLTFFSELFEYAENDEVSKSMAQPT